MSETNNSITPKNWDQSIHKQWLAGDTKGAIEAMVEKINGFGKEKPKEILVQLAYYLFLINDYLSAATLFKSAHDLYPNDKEILLNLGVCLSRGKKSEEAITYLKKLLKQDTSNYVAWDALANSYHRIGDEEKATRAGTNSLVLKDKLHGDVKQNDWQIPNVTEEQKNKKKVIAFSLWGNQKRYIFGTLRNLLLAPDIYPDWELWFYVDESVSAGFLEIIEQLGGKVIIQPNNQPQHEKLCWRFNIANEENVGYFLVRDADSVFSVRESLAVDEWLKSGKCFHIIRDWWTHTDLILAGLWGGIAGSLPPIKTLVESYQSGKVTTPNIDQWFLRDCLWRYIKTDCLIHDRCYNHLESLPVPGNEPKDGDHIGSCEHFQKPGFQEKVLSAWIAQGKSG